MRNFAKSLNSWDAADPDIIITKEFNDQYHGWWNKIRKRKLEALGWDDDKALEEFLNSGILNQSKSNWSESLILVHCVFYPPHISKMSGDLWKSRLSIALVSMTD